MTNSACLMCKKPFQEFCNLFAATAVMDRVVRKHSFEGYWGLPAKKKIRTLVFIVWLSFLKQEVTELLLCCCSVVYHHHFFRSSSKLPYNNGNSLTFPLFQLQTLYALSLDIHLRFFPFAQSPVQSMGEYTHTLNVPSELISLPLNLSKKIFEVKKNC